MRYSVIATTIDVNWRPVINFSWIPSLFFVVRISIAPEIPATTSIAIKSISLTRHFFAVNDDFHEFFGFGESATTRAVRFIIVNFRQHNWKLVFWNRMRIAIFVVSDRNWRAPVTLARNEPVAHAISNLFLANALLLEPSNNLFTCIRALLAIKCARIYELAFAMIALVIIFGTERFFDNFDNR